MNREEMLAAVLFFEKVRERIGTEDFLRHKDIIVQTVADTLDVWREQGGDTVQLLENENMALVTVLVCGAQDAMDVLLYGKEEG